MALKDKILEFFASLRTMNEVRKMEKIYEKKFETSDMPIRDGLYQLNKEASVLARMRGKADKIPMYARDAGVQEQAFAAFCFSRAFEEGYEHLKYADERFTHIKQFGPSKPDIGSPNVIKETYLGYKGAKTGFELAKQIEEENNLPQKENIDIFIEAVEERMRYLQEIKEYFEVFADDVYDFELPALEKPEEMKKSQHKLSEEKANERALDLADELISKIKDENLEQRANAVIEADLEKWFGEEE